VPESARIPALFPEERQRQILQRALAAGRVDVAALTEEFGVTAETVRRDLGLLERQGHLRRVHGGAIPVDLLVREPALQAREESMRAEKGRIAEAVVGLLGDAASVLLDAGTTTARIVDLLPADRELTVVTNSLPIAQAAVARPALTVHVVGGRIRPRTLAAVDAQALRDLTDVYVDVAVIGTNGVSVRRGLSTPDPAEAAVKRAMVRAARRRILVADHTKIGVDHFARFAALADVDLLVTDKGADPEEVAGLRAAGLAVTAV
jgi:DeoR family fructose operon transcriptional repressor